MVAFSYDLHEPPKKPSNVSAQMSAILAIPWILDVLVSFLIGLRFRAPFGRRVSVSVRWDTGHRRWLEPMGPQKGS